MVKAEGLEVDRKEEKNQTESLTDLDINKKLQWILVYLQGEKNWSVHKIKTHHVLCFKKTHNHSLNRDHLFKWGLPLHTQTLTLINGDYTGKNHNIGDRWRTRWQLSEISANKHKRKKILDYKTLLLDIRQSTYKLANCPITYWFVKWSRQRCNLI